MTNPRNSKLYFWTFYIHSLIFFSRPDERSPPVLVLSRVEPTLRVMQSFDSSLTARAPSSEPTEMDHGDGNIPGPSKARFTTELFDVFQDLLV